MSGMIKTTLREIRQSLGRYLAILAIAALGVGMFSGLKITKPFMVESVQQYFEEKQLYDFRLLSNYGFEETDVKYLADQSEAYAVQGAYNYDVLYEYGENEGQQVIKVHSITSDINGLEVLYGRLPQQENECVVDSRLYGEDAIGQVIRVAEENKEDTLDVFRCREFTISGVVNASYYIQFERGNTSVGNGKISGFMYVLPSAFDSDVYTEIFVKLKENFHIYSDEYDAYIKEQKPLWEEYLEQATELRFERIKNDAEKELEDAETTFAKERADAEADLKEAEVQLLDAKKQLDESAKQMQDGKAQIQSGRSQIAAGYAELDANEANLIASEAELEENKKLLESQEQELSAGLAQLQEKQTLLTQQKNNLKDQEKELNLSEEDLLTREASLLTYEQSIREQLSAGLITEETAAGILAEVEAGKADVALGKQQIEAARTEIEKGYVQLEDGQKELDQAKKELDDGMNQITAGKEQLVQGEVQIQEGKKQIQSGREQLKRSEEELNVAEADLKDGEAKYQDGLREYEDGWSEYQEGLADFQTEITDAEAEIRDARDEIQDMDAPKGYLLGRDTNIGYVCLESDSDIVEDVSMVLPIFFFLIAALVCMTTMSRMIEEQRTQIGVLKALGYGNATILGKYLFYSGSAAGIGCALGFLGGTFFLSRIIWDAYGIMYDFGQMIYYFDWKLALFCFLCSMLASVGVTWFCCRTELTHVAAVLMRPKAPKAGKRVFLEKIPFIWRRLSFLVKVSVRNVLRYKKRFFMMVIGISGCTGLLVTGFGILDSIGDVIDMQYEEIMQNDISVTFDEKYTKEDMEQAAELIKNQDGTMLLFGEGSLDITYEGCTKSISYIVPQFADEIGDYIDLHTEKGEPIPYPKKGEAVISSKIADVMNIEIGDEIQLTDEDHRIFTLRVVNICQNFVYNYVYFNADSYQLWKEPLYQTLYINMGKEGVDSYQFAADLMSIDHVTNVTINEDVKARFNNMMGSLDFIVLVVIICAAALAFIVLYNLTNINITERVREIATIKVLGFHKKETADYVFRENIALTAIGGLLGLILGKVFHWFVMSCINIDLIAFDVRINWDSYVYSLILTFVFAWFVNQVMSRKLDRISMTESLKSVD